MSNYLQYMHDPSPFLLYKYLCLPISKHAFLQMSLPLMQIPLHFCTSRLCACTFLCLSTSKYVIFPTSIPLHDSLHICGSASTSLFLPAGFSACQYICLPACACISLLACRRSFLSKRLLVGLYCFQCILVFLSTMHKFSFTLSSDQGMQPDISSYYFVN
jgi:hypothetical protein